MFSKKICLLLLLILVTTVIGLAESDEIFFTGTPTISPDAKKVVFSYEGDLWMVDSGGGTAYRLTGMQGDELYPRFSPDGKWLAFSGSQDGNSNVYIMPANGGKIKQLTYHSGRDRVDSWSWDSKYIYFNSGRYNSVSVYKIAVDGGTPIRMFDHFFNTIHGLVKHPVSGDYYFTDTMESFAFPSRKGYKGDYNPDIKSYNPTTGSFTVHTSYRGKDFHPTIDGKGTVYFVSDRTGNEFNLFTLREGKAVGLTNFKRSIKSPQVSANGKKVVFVKEYQLFIYDTENGKTVKIPVRLFENNTLNIHRTFNVNGKITNFDLSPDGKKFAFVSRGELFVSDTKGKFIKQLHTAALGRVMEVKWLKDNKTLLFNQTVDGWQNLFKIRADKNEKETQLTFDKANNGNITLNADKSKALYISGLKQIKLMDLVTFKSRTIVEDELWGSRSDSAYFSPDEEYVVFTAYRHFERDIFLYHFKTGKKINLTSSGLTELHPYWSPDGKYLFFAANRHSPFYPRGYSGTKIYRLPLQKYQEDFKSVKLDDLFKEEKKEKKGKNGKETAGHDKKQDKQNKVTIDFRELNKRWEQISPNSGTQWLLHVTVKNGEYTVIYLSNHDGGSGYNIWKTELKPFKSPETKKIAGPPVNDIELAWAKDKYYILVDGKIGELNLNANKIKAIKMNYAFERSLAPEFKQMFFEVWANLDENFYDENHHGIEWEKTKDDYAEFLPYIRTRAHLRTLITDMLGELNASHLGFGSSGDEEKTLYSLKSIQPGILFENNSPYTVKEVITGSAADKAGIDVKPGDVLIAVNNKPVDPRINREFYFTGPAQTGEMALRFKRESKGVNKTFTVNIHPIPANRFRNHLYDRWTRHNQELVDKKSNRRIAYIHMRNMGEGQLANFLIEMTTEHHHRDALILDLRYNTGGNVHDAVLSFLSQRPYSFWKFREGEFAPQPNFAPAAKPIVLLINEQSLSDAEMTAAGFKQLKLGKIIGTETYRWLIFTGGRGLVDGSYYRLPGWGCYTYDKKNIETNGVKPDKYIKNTFKDRLEGKDPQLQAAIDEILSQLKNK